MSGEAILARPGPRGELVGAVQSYRSNENRPISGERWSSSQGRVPQEWEWGVAGADKTVIPPPPARTALIQEQSSCPSETKVELSSSVGPRAGEPGTMGWEGRERPRRLREAGPGEEGERAGQKGQTHFQGSLRGGEPVVSAPG
ncbi:hypothetical protein MC885_020131 [Smutsia gigantea]|nr:hypothetical protein MC885_020131 [Smutsia gigantea]